MMWPGGFKSSGVASGIKANGEPDLGLLMARGETRWAGTFTRNAAAAAPVLWCRERLAGPVRAVVVNSGNANACTGSLGMAAVEDTAQAAATVIGCSPEHILVASTGPIGVPLPVARLVEALPVAARATTSDVEGFSRAILTTDTRPKVAAVTVGGASIVGVAKGAAMLAPRMATMLAFIVTDARVSHLQDTLRISVSRTFDRISVDACESTNDSVFLLAQGTKVVDDALFAKALDRVCGDLARQMVRDAEGGSRVVRIQVAGATSEDEAVTLGRAVAASALWRAAVGGADPNWGRVLAAMGSAVSSLELDRITIGIGPETIFERGEPVGSLGAAAKAMQADEFTLSCLVGDGPGEAEILSTDLSTAYVTLNAVGTT